MNCINMEQSQIQVKPTINLIPIRSDREAELARENYIVDRYYGVQSDLQTVLDVYREMRDMTKKQQEPINTVDAAIQNTLDKTKQSEQLLTMADDEKSKERARKISITAGIVSGVVLTGVLAGAPVTIPVGVAAGVASWMIWRN